MLNQNDEALVFKLLDYLLISNEHFLSFNTSLLKEHAIIKTSGLKELSNHWNQLALTDGFIQTLTVMPNFKEIDWVNCRQDEFLKVHRMFYEYAEKLHEMISQYESGNYQVNYQVNVQNNNKGDN